jgi:hypothetical protein
MDALAAATASAPAVSTVGSHFMLHGGTYARGAELGFQGLDFYVTGRGGVLGDVDADVVSAAFGFLEPAQVRTLWDQGRAVLAPQEAAARWAECCATWAEAKVPDDLDVDLERLGSLLDAVVTQARPAGAPVFCGWRALPVPSSPKAHVVHQLNGLRELRHGLHVAAVLAAGLSPLEALSHNHPQMAPLFGWPDLADTTEVGPRWDAAEAATSVAMAHAFEGLGDGGRDELVDLAGRLHQAVKG